MKLGWGRVDIAVRPVDEVNTTTIIASSARLLAFRHLEEPKPSTTWRDRPSQCAINSTRCCPTALIVLKESQPKSEGTARFSPF